MGNRFIVGRKCSLDWFHLCGMNDLLAAIPQARAKLSFAAQGLDSPVINRNDVDGLQIVRRTGDQHRLPGIQQLNRIFGARRADGCGVILPSKNDCIQTRMRREFLEIQNPFGSLHSNQNADGVDRPAVFQLRGFDDFGCPIHMLKRFHFWNDNPIGTTW